MSHSDDEVLCQSPLIRLLSLPPKFHSAIFTRDVKEDKRKFHLNVRDQKLQEQLSAPGKGTHAIPVLTVGCSRLPRALEPDPGTLPFEAACFFLPLVLGLSPKPVH